jgi:hypothetical protein
MIILAVLIAKKNMLFETNNGRLDSLSFMAASP